MRDQLNIRILDVSDVPRDVLESRWPRKKRFDPELTDEVRTIIDEVKKQGDAALVDFAMKFDGVALSPDRLRVNREDIERACEEVGEEEIAAINSAKSRVEAFQKELLSRISFECKAEGIKIRSSTSPVRRVGCYVPGGEAAYPSSLVMMVAPAKIAGVREIVVCSPPRRQGEINPLTLVAADICGVDEIYRVGGAQAIAALAYGTETIRPVDKIVGPGNKYVLAAKMLVSQHMPIDIPAGPSEIVVLADESADPEVVALDMISQSEHKDGVSVLVTTSKRLAQTVAEELKRLAPSIPNREMVIQNLSRNGWVLVCEDMEEAIGFVNDFAPEHLEVMAEDACTISREITSAGLILTGKYTPVSASDYCLGTNHILPTEGFSQVYSGLSVLDFVRRFDTVECSKEGLVNVRRNVKVLAEAEGLVNHALAVEGRFRNE